MKNEQIYDMVRQTRIVAIVRGLDGHFTELAQALYDGGIRAMEVTFRLGNPDEFYKTADSIREIRAAMGDRMAVGAGVGGKLVNKEWIEEGAWDKITALAHALCENAQA